MNFPLVSIVVPVYNTAVYLPCCLGSLLRQTYSRLEIICVDDGSTDDSWRILQEYSAIDTRIKIFHQPNAGVSVARNKALAHATGEWLAFIDSDDWLDTDAMERARGITIFSKQAEVTLNYGENPLAVTFMDTPGHVDFSAEMAFPEPLCGRLRSRRGRYIRQYFPARSCSFS